VIFFFTFSAELSNQLMFLQNECLPLKYIRLVL